MKYGLISPVLRDLIRLAIEVESVLVIDTSKQVAECKKNMDK